MGSEWTVRPLEDCMAALIDYRGKTPRKTSSGIPLVTAKVVKGGRIDTPGEFIAIDDYEAWMRRGIPKAGDVVVTTEAPMGEVAQLGPERVALAQRLIAMRGKDGLLDNGFLKFLMQSENVQQQLAARASGTTVLGIKQSELRRILLTLPPYGEQRAIAHILGTLDEKIELNRKMNETLEAMARTVFKSWFVDFDPVRAKAEGRDPGLPPALAALFPDSLTASEFGDVPRGWVVQRLGSCCAFAKGVSYRSDELQESPIAMVTLKSFRREGGYKEDGLKPFTGRYKPEQVIAPGEVVVAHTDVTQSADVLGRAVRVPRSPQFQILVASLDAVIARPAAGISREFLSLLLGRQEFQDHARSYSNGTTVLHLRSTALPNYQFVRPDAAVIAHFTKLIQPMFSRIDLNGEESRTLAELRDTLLPKLISGEARVPHAERIVEVAE